MATISGASRNAVNSASAFAHRDDVGGIVLVGSILLIIATWGTVVSPWLGAAWNGGSPPNITQSDVQLLLGGVVFIAILAMIAASGGADFAWLTMIAIAIVFLVMNGTPFLSGVFNFLGGYVYNVPSQSSSSSSNSSTSTGSGGPSAPTQPVKGS